MRVTDYSTWVSHAKSGCHQRIAGELEGLPYIFDACRRAKLNQKPACQELQTRLKKGPKWPQKQSKNTKFEKIFFWGDPPEGPCVPLRTQSRTLLDQLKFASSSDVAQLKQTQYAPFRCVQIVAFLRVVLPDLSFWS